MDSSATAPAPPFGAEHELLRAEIRAFVASELRPRADEWESARAFPDEVFGWFADRGWLGLKYERAYGGSERGELADAVLVEELGRCRSGGVAAGVGAHVSIATPPVARFGTDEHKRRFLAPAIAGERIGALAITEPDAGSDVASLRTVARPVADGYVVDGSKLYITNGCRAHFLVAAVRTRPLDAGGGDRHHGISFLIVERGPGVDSRPLEKLGWHASDTALVTFDAVPVPAANLLGPEHEGFKLIMANFQWERLAMALGAVGAMEDVLELAGAPPPEARVALDSSRALTYHALARYLDGGQAVREVTIAKLHSQRAAVGVADACLTAAGGQHPELERHLRDARLGPIGGGTDEIMKEILGRTLGL